MVDRAGIISQVEAGLRMTDLRQSVLANNIANLETPQFRRGDIRFDEELAEAIHSGSASELAELSPEVVQPMDTPVSPAGNDVNMDMEVGELLKNSGRYKTLMRVMSKMYHQMDQAMQVE